MIAAFAGGAQAKTDEREKVEILYETTLNLIHLLVEQGVIKQEVADEMIRKAEAKGKGLAPASPGKSLPPAAGEPKKGEVRVTYVPEHIKKEIRDQLREEVVGQAKQEGWGDVNAVPEWTSRFKMEGDIRLREQADFYASTQCARRQFSGNWPADRQYHRGQSSPRTAPHASRHQCQRYSWSGSGVALDHR